eukprot:3293685-Amphidinium_carterae.2
MPEKVLRTAALWHAQVYLEIQIIKKPFRNRHFISNYFDCKCQWTTLQYLLRVFLERVVADRIAELFSVKLQTDVVGASNVVGARAAATIAEASILLLHTGVKAGKYQKLSASKSVQECFKNITANSRKWGSDVRALMHSSIVAEGLNLNSLT